MVDELREILNQVGLELGEVIAVPDFDCGVQAGIPREPGDAWPGVSYIPSDLFGDGNLFTVTVRGESMRDYDLKEGDRLMVRMQATAECGDIVIASINGASTVKTYFEDEDGGKWLIPGNEAFDPIELKPEDDNRIVGVVKQIIHETPRTSYRDCMKILKSRKKDSKQVVRNVDIARAFKAAVETMSARGLKGSRPWFAVYRVFVDRSVIEKGDYTGFVAMTEEIMKEDAPTINIKDMRGNVEVLSFDGPVSLWNADNAPVSGKRFYDYLEVAKATKSALLNK